MPKKLTQEQFISEATVTHGGKYDYSRVEYKNSTSKVEIGCPTHGWFLQIAGDHRRGIGCSRCADELHSKRTYDAAKAEILKRFELVHGNLYDYSDFIYGGANTDSTIICKIHGPFQQKPVNHVSGKGCPKCAQDIRAASRTLGDEVWLERFKEAHGDLYEFSEAVRIRTTKKAKIICPTHGAFFQKPQNHAAGEGCPKCAVNHTDSQESVIRKFIAAHGDRYDYSKVKYVSSDEYVTIVCPSHGEFQQIPDGHIQGKGCWKCSVEQRFEVSKTSRSAPEKELEAFVVSLGVDVCHGYLPNSDNKWTYDIIVPSHKLAIEFNGVYWHSYPRTIKGAHYYKRKSAEAAGFRLITIWEDEWKEKADRMRSLVRRALLGSSTRIGARQTSVGTISSREAKLFHEKYHVQDFRVSMATEHFSLKKGEEVVAVASFDKQGTLHRYTVKEGLSVLGGLLKVVKAYRAVHGCLDVTTYCDRDYFDGKVYKAAGFEETGGSMMLTYAEKGKRVRRERYMKHKLPEKFGEVDLNKKEVDICADNGVFACWNSGVTRYTLRV